MEARQTIPRASGRMTGITMPGYFDTARHNPLTLIRYYSSEIRPISLTIGPWTTRSVYFTDMRLPNGTPPTSGYDRIDQAIAALRRHARHVAHVLLIAPDYGLEGRPHIVGGGWSAPGCHVTFYVARNPNNGKKFLCANIY